MLIELPGGDFVDHTQFKAITARATGDQWRMEVTFNDGSAAPFAAPSEAAAREAVKALAVKVNAMTASATMSPDHLRQMVADRNKTVRK